MFSQFFECPRDYGDYCGSQALTQGPSMLNTPPHNPKHYKKYYNCFQERAREIISKGSYPIISAYNVCPNFVGIIIHYIIFFT